MKRIYKVMACTMLAVALTGCKNKTAPSNGDDSVISLTKEDYKITANDLYQTLKEKYATNYIIQEVDKVILNKEYETSDEAKEYVENQIKIYQMMYGNSESELLTALQNAGYKDLDEFKDTIAISFKRQQATKDYEKKQIKESEIKDYYEDNIYGDIEISHILIKLDATDTMTDEEKKEAEQKAAEKIAKVYEKLNGGEKFSDVAKELSEDSATKENGGKVGTFNKEEMSSKFNKEFEEAAMNLKVGNYTKKTVKTSYGYHIIYKDKENEKPSLEDSKNTIIDKLVEQKMDEDSKAEYRAMIQLREDYGFTINDDDVKKQYETAKNNWLYGKED